MNLTQQGAESYCRNRILNWAVPAMLFMLSFATPTPTLADALTIGTGACPGASVGSGAASVSCSVNAGPGDITSYSASGDLSTGVFGVEASVVQVPCLELPGGCGASISQFVEVTYVFGGLGLLSGTAQFNLTANGTLSDALAAAEFEVSPSESLIVNGIPAFPPFTTSLPSGMTSLTVDTPITAGSGTLNFTLLVSATCNAGGACTSQADFLDPLTIMGASAFDVNGNPVSATFVSESGFNPNGGGAVPEPSSLSLLCIGMLGLVVLSLKKAVA